MHPVVHDWVTESISRGRRDLMGLALRTVGLAVPEQSESAYWVMQQRLLPHANRCAQQHRSAEQWGRMEDSGTDDAFHGLGNLYADQGKLSEAEKMHERALEGREKALGHRAVQTYIPALNTLENLAALHAQLSRKSASKKLYLRALDGIQTIYGQRSKRYRRVSAALQALNNDEND